MINVISTALTTSVTPGAGDYASTLTIIGSGSVIPSAAGDTAVYSDVAGVSLINQGAAVGATGVPIYQDYQTAGVGGGGVSLGSEAYLYNSGRIQGGTGGAGENTYNNANAGAGGVGVAIGDGTVVNAGSILGGFGGIDLYGYGGAGGAGVSLGGGTIINHAVIAGGAGGSGSNDAGGAGGTGVAVTDGAVSNFGSIYGGDGGAVGDLFTKPGAGGTGVSLASGTLLNSGVIGGGQGQSGQIYAGSAGGIGVSLGASASLTNSGTITGGAGGAGVANNYNSGVGGAGGAGLVIRGGGATNSAAIAGGQGGVGGTSGAAGAGVYLDGGTLINAGTIAGGAANGGVQGDAVRFGGVAGGSFVNGSSGSSSAVIEGNVGVVTGAYGAATVTNYGTIEGTGGGAVSFASSNDRLIVEAGSTFIGSIAGGGGTLELADGGVTITGLGGSGMLSGVAAGQFSGFGSYAFDAKTYFVGVNTATGEIENAGTSSVNGGEAFAFFLADGATLSGGGEVALSAKGVIGGTSLDNIDNTLTGHGFIENLTSLTNGTAGVIEAVGGRMLINLAGNTVINDGVIEAVASNGVLLVSDTAIDSSGGGRVEASGQIQLNRAKLLGGALTIDKGGKVISSTFASTIDLKGGTVTNAGTLEGAGAGLTVDDDVANTGLVIAEGGSLTITGDVTGTGKIEVFGKQRLEIDGAQGGTIAFGAGSTGRLMLGDSAAFSGTVTGLSRTGLNAIDLKDVVYSTGDTAVYVANKNANTGGVLTVSDGTHTATIKLAGANYGSSANFKLSQDSGTGTIVIDPPAGAHAFVAAMAGFAPAAGSAATAADSARPPAALTLAHGA